MKNLENLIIQARRATENEDVDEVNGIGIKDAEFIQYFNDAQYRLQSLITQQHPRVFLSENIQTCDGSETYSLPADAFINNRVDTVEYTTGGDDSYYILGETSLKNRNGGSGVSPQFYIRSTGKIYLIGKPSSGKVRITYIKKLDELVNNSDIPGLPSFAERYLLSFVEWKILKRDSSIDSTEALQELSALEGEIINSYKHINEDVSSIPEINQWDDWSYQ
jgi:hypothetical protein